MSTLKLRKYKKSAEFGYSFGVFPTIEMLESIPEHVVEVIFHSRSSSNKGAGKISQICENHSIPSRFSDSTIARITAKSNIYAVGVFRKFKRSLEIGSNHIVLENPADSGNLGTIIRTMMGFGVTDLGLILPAVDHFDPKVIRASMGSIFKINLQTFHSFQEYSEAYKNNIYPMMVNGESILEEVNFKEPFTLVFGNESRGLSEGFQEIGKSVSIKHSSEIDSLNLAVSVGIVLHKAAKITPPGV